MEASAGAPRIAQPRFEPDTEAIKLRLLNKGVNPTPKIIHTLRKKEIQKSTRKASKSAAAAPGQLTDSEKRAVAEDVHFLTLRQEYKEFVRAVGKVEERDAPGAVMVGRPWEGVERAALREAAGGRGEYGGEGLRGEALMELGRVLEGRRREEVMWVLDDDVEVGERRMEEKGEWDGSRRRTRTAAEAVQFLIDRLSAAKLNVKDWKLGRMMKQSQLEFNEGQLLRVVEGLGEKGLWKHALSVVEWAYEDNGRKQLKSRFVYTKLLAVLGKAGMPQEALRIFNSMCGDRHLYPDMAAYRSISVTLGQSGLLKELLEVIESLQNPSAQVLKMRRRNWDPTLQPDIVVYNAVVNACVAPHQWKGVSWVFQQMRKNSVKPDGASYGLAMEVMLRSRKYGLVHDYFQKMRKSGGAPKALSYKVLVRAFWEEGRVDEAVDAVRDMEKRGVVGTASVYYELVCCLCNNGRWRDAMMEVQKLKQTPLTRPLEVTFTGMIASAMNGGYIEDCVSLFEHMQDHCAPNIGTVNIMLKVYGKNDMFAKARALFEEIKAGGADNDAKNDSKVQLRRRGAAILPDAFTYASMLEASAKAHQWEYFEYVYKEMTLSGHQLDQSKHSSMLVEASKAGKVHLLEHAFDKTLEAGEVPHVSFFIELICQAAANLNLDRAVTLVRTLGYAPTILSEVRWTEIFEKNVDRMGGDILVALLGRLRGSDMPEEPTILNMVASLESICGRNEKFSNAKQLPGPIKFNGNSSLANDYQPGNGIASEETSEMDDFIRELALDEAASDFDDDNDDDYMGLSDEEDEGVPSAGEILESWKKVGKDGGLDPPQLGRKSLMKYY
uniref:Pentatricopeptide repeat-containing protein n=1 Tax=Kalanchoe fedtschenkoi TaxID=63787 RepID=A0A7N0T5I1_KALFE